MPEDSLQRARRLRQEATLQADIQESQLRERRMRQRGDFWDVPPLEREIPEFNPNEDPLQRARRIRLEREAELRDYLENVRQMEDFGTRGFSRRMAGIRRAATEMGAQAYTVAENLYEFLNAANARQIINIDLTTPAYLLNLVKQAGQILGSGKILYGAGNDLYKYVKGSDEDIINEAYDGFITEVIKTGEEMPADIENYMKRLNTSARLLATNPDNTEAQSLFNKNLKEAIYIQYNDLLKTSRQLNDYSTNAMKKRVLGNFDGRREIYLNRPDISDLGIVPSEQYKY